MTQTSCWECGIPLKDSDPFCPGCGAPAENPTDPAAPAPPGLAKVGEEVTQADGKFTALCTFANAENLSKPVLAAADKIRAASIDAFRAFGMFVLNPVGGLVTACESVGSERSFGVGIVFGAVSSLFVLLGVYGLLPGSFRPQGLSGFMKILLVALAPSVSLFGGTVIADKVFQGEGGLGRDSFISGASLLPFGFVILSASILGFENIEIVGVLTLFAVCLTILMLFAGLTRICRISDRLGTIAVPLILLIDVWTSRIVCTTILNAGDLLQQIGGGS